MQVAKATRRIGAFVARAGTAAIVIYVINLVFDYGFTAWVVYNFDPLPGMLIFMVTGLALNYAVIVWYKRTKTDWFGAEWLRMQESIESDTWYAKLVHHFRNVRFLMFGLLSLWDPIYGFIHMQGRKTGSRFTASDWFWFTLANCLGLFSWFFGAYAVFELVIVRIME